MRERRRRKRERTRRSQKRRSSPRVERTLSETGGKAAEEDVKGKEKEARIEKEESEEKPARGNPGGESSGSRPPRPLREEEDLQHRLDAYVHRHPRSFELGTLPRREESRHHEDREAETRPDTRRPREPDRPPPGHFAEEEESVEIRRRPVPKPKKNKGRTHRERGRHFRRPGPRS